MVIESMKVEIPIKAGIAGRVKEIHVRPVITSGAIEFSRRSNS